MTNTSRTLNSAVIKEALEAAGMTQKDLAKQLEVTAQAVTNWLKGKDFPRPPKLLKLAVTLNLTADQLVQSDDSAHPIVAFRKKGSSKTTLEHIRKAEHIGKLLRPLVPFLTGQNSIRPVFRASSENAAAIASAAMQTREKLGIGKTSTVKYVDLIGEFSRCGAVLVPVMWGKQEKHKNALHIYLPGEEVTFIFLNLDTRTEDFKFWMAHELAHVYTPDLAGKEAGEDFADEFAGSLLFPENMARQTYRMLSDTSGLNAQKEILEKLALKHKISVYTVYAQTQKYAEQSQQPALSIAATSIHKLRNNDTGKLVSETVFKGITPTAQQYLKVCNERFETDFFSALQKMIKERDVAAGYLQQVLSITHAEAYELHQALMR